MKHHNNLTDDQIHLPKGFQPAQNRSVLIKNSTGSLVWKNANYTTSTVVTCLADLGGSLHHTYFCLYSSQNANKYAVYIDLENTAMAIPSGYHGVIRVDVATGQNSTAIQIADTMAEEISRSLYFTATNVSGTDTVTITGTTSATDPFDVSTQFSISSSQTKLLNEHLTTNEDGSIGWEAISREGTDVHSTGETGGTKFLREDGDGTCSWQTVAAGLTVKEEGVALATDASSLNFVGSGVVASGTGANKTITITDTQGVNSIVAGTNVTISPSNGVGAVTINASGGGGETSFNTTTTWRGVIAMTESGRAATAYTFDNPVANRYEFNMNVGIGFIGSNGVIGNVLPRTIIPAARVNITTTGTQNYSWVGKILANQASVGGFLRLYKATLVCDGEAPENYALSLLAVVTVPPINQWGHFCFEYTQVFPSPLIKGDVILPVFDGQNGANNLTYTNTLELNHA